jgi:hypothetical protein
VLPRAVPFMVCQTRQYVGRSKHVLRKLRTFDVTRQVDQAQALQRESADYVANSRQTDCGEGLSARSAWGKPHGMI